MYNRHVPKLKFQNRFYGSEKNKKAGKMKKQTSITKIINLIIAVAIIAYSALIFYTVQSRLNSGLEEYFEEDTKTL